MKKECMLLAGLLFAATASAGVWEDFEASSPWGSWADAKSPKPAVTIETESGSGSGTKCMQLVFPGAESYCGVSKGGLQAPETAVSLQFWVKPVEGNIPHTVIWQVSNEDKTRDVFRANFDAGKTGEWKKVVIPISNFKYVYSQGKANSPVVLDRQKPFELAFLLDAKQPKTVFQIDDLSWTE